MNVFNMTYVKFTTVCKLEETAKITPGLRRQKLRKKISIS